MSRREDIDNAIWGDPDFEALSANATLLYLWSWTNLRCGMAGMYKVSLRAMAESKVSEADLPAALAELAESRFAFYEDNVLWVRSRVKHLNTKSPKIAISIENDLLKIPASHPLVAKFAAEYESSKWLGETVKRAYRDRMVTLSEKPVNKGDSHTLSGPSPEGPRSGTGTGFSGSGLEGGPGETKKAELPADFPTVLRPHLEAVFRILRSLAERHNAKAPGVVSLASVVMANPNKPLVKSAHACASYWDGRAQHVKDVVAAYRNWLDKVDEIAGVEQIPSVTNGSGDVVLIDSKRAQFDKAAGLR